MRKSILTLIILFTLAFSCVQSQNNANLIKEHQMEYFNLRPEVEKMSGYTHAIKIGNSIKISGAVSMDSLGNPTGKNDMLQQIKNCYDDIDKILKHYDCTYHNVVVENIFTTDMQSFLQHSVYRNEIYQNQFPTGSWLEVKGLAFPEFLVEIEVEAHITEE